MRLRLACIALLLAGCPGEPEPDCGPSTTVPTPRTHLAGGWDAVNGRLVAVGGDQGAVVECEPQPSFTNQAVAFDATCGGFVALGGDTLPFPRGGHAATTNSTRQTLYLHGGRHRDTGQGGEYSVFGDLWALEFGTDTWTELTPSGDPPGRFDHALVFAGGVVVHGGNRSTGASVDALDDLWRYDLLTGLWERLEPTGGPGPRHQHAAAAGPTGQTIYVFGGAGGVGQPAEADLWALTLDPPEWTELHDGGGGPERRVGASLAVDEANNRLLLFGGQDDGPLGYRNDLWAFDLNARSWTALAAGDVAGSSSASGCGRTADAVVQDLTAPERRAFAAVALGNDGGLRVFAGRTECGAIDDVWSWSGSWSRLREATAGRSCARAGLDCTTICP